ncbi:MAG: SGNH/GDSL hydrolase family protein [Victivallales bacterium]|nr:SGNH/GDSL hydrolase family protein [Victivallales bacterium]
MDLKNTQWSGKKVAFLGDSITDKVHVGTEKNYWQFLNEWLGLEHLVYGINGHRMIDILGQAKKLHDEHGDNVDAIFIFAGTNDFNGGVPMGEWWSTAMEEVNSHGRLMVKQRRHFLMDETTFRGRINIVMAYLKETFPLQQIVLMTPIHRGFATFGGTNIQPEESFTNDIGLYVDEYIQAIKDAGNIWAVPVIDLNSISGLYPLTPSHAPFFHVADTDLLHPGAEGHRRMALAMAYQMLSLPATFKKC